MFMNKQAFFWVFNYNISVWEKAHPKLSYIFFVFFNFITIVMLTEGDICISVLLHVWEKASLTFFENIHK